MGKRHKKLFPWWAIVSLDIAGILTVLAVFALFPLIIPQKGEPIRHIAQVSTAAPLSASADNLTVPLRPASSSEPAHTGDFSATFPSQRTTEHENLVIDIKKDIRQCESGPAVYFAADVYIRDISCLKTAFAEGMYGTGIHESLEDMAKNNNAVLAITGDYFGARPDGIVIRNGDLYRDSSLEDVCVIYTDGVMETYTDDEFDLAAAEARGAYQAWSFGPQLLINGEPVTDFETGIYRYNPRTAIGYIAPGHYVFVVVDGRQDGYSKGMNLAELSQLMYDLGCETAYNLDGGQTSAMYYAGEIVNRPYNGGREISDIIYIGD